MKKDVSNQLIWTITIIAIVIYGICCASLHSNQILLSYDGSFESDIPAHISMALEDNWFYSLMGLLIKVFYLTGYGPVLLSGLLAITTVATIFATYLLMQELTGKYFSSGMILVFAFISNIIMPFYLALAGKQRYIGYQSPSVWHNSTYILMKLLGTLTLWYFIKLREKYLEGLKVKEWLIFCGLLILCNAAKPSFCMMFDFAMLSVLIVDLFKKTDISFLDRLKKIVVFGCAVLPSLLVILWQNNVLFGDDTGNGIVINPGYALAMRGDHPKVTFILSIAFPLFILICNIKDLKWDKRFRFAWVMWLFAFLEVFLLTEEGNRALDSNFFWGYSFAIFVVNILSMVKLIENTKNTEGIYESDVLRISITSIGTVLMAYQCYCGIYFFAQLLKGTTYWM